MSGWRATAQRQHEEKERKCFRASPSGVGWLDGTRVVAEGDMAGRPPGRRTRKMLPIRKHGRRRDVARGMPPPAHRPPMLRRATGQRESASGGPDSRRDCKESFGLAFSQAVLRHVNAAIGKLFHLRIPSLLMRARAQATVRVWKNRLEHQAHSRSDIRGGCGLPVATRAES
jgi:hypothetical protein